MKNEKGFVLITAVIFSFLMIGLVSSYFILITVDRGAVVASSNSLKAETIAEAGIEEVFWEYNYGGNDFTGWSGSGTTRNKTVSYTDTSGNTIGSYTVTVTNFTNTAPPLPRATSVGTFNAPSSNVVATVVTELQTSSLYNYAFKGKGKILYDSNSFTDSYNSSLGPYGGANINDEGNVITNGTALDIIELKSNATVNGDAATGTGGTVKDDSPPSVTGTISHNANEAVPNITVPPALVGLPSSGAITNSITLNAGSYRYTNINLPSVEVLTINGAVQLYISNTGSAIQMNSNTQIVINAGSSLVLYSNGNVDMNSNILINWTGIASTFQILGTPNCTSFLMNSNASLTGIINAPNATIFLDSNSVVYGAVIGDNLTLKGNNAIHYDENLVNFGGGGGYDLKWYRRTQ